MVKDKYESAAKSVDEPTTPSDGNSSKISRNRGLLSVGVTLCLALGLTIASLMTHGAGLAARTATDLVMPLGLLWLLIFSLATWFALQRNRIGSVFFFCLWLLIGVVFNSRVAMYGMALIEHPGVGRAAQDLPPLRAVVVLGGGTTVASDGTDELNRDGERVMSAAQMWHAGETRSIICTGGIGDDRYDPSAVSRRLLLSVGVPDDAIVTILGENTSQEMRQLQQLFESPPDRLPDDGKLGLITSAFHMNRAMRLAKTRSLKFIPFPCAYRATKSAGFVPRELVPNAGAGAVFGVTLKEQLARLFGR